jgi:hypothetical protein
LFHKYTGIGGENKTIIAAIQGELTRNISKVLADLQDEIHFAFDREIGASCLEWTEIPVYAKVLQVVALVSGRTFVGIPLSRDKEWTDATINFTIDMGSAIKALHKYNPLVRTFLSHFLPQVRRLLAYRKFAGRKLKPQVDAILEARSSMASSGWRREKISADDEEAVAKGSNSGNFNMIHWILNHVPDISSADAVMLGKSQMLIAFAAIHTTSMALSHAIFDLAAYPECIPELRAEVEAVIREEGYADGNLRKMGIQKLKKLDSFIKESQRMNPLGMSTCLFLFLFPPFLCHLSFIFF